MNHVVLIGRLTRDPELRYIAGTGTPVANFAIAVDREFSGKDGKKETLVAIQGSLRIDSYQNQAGETRRATRVNANRVQFLDTKNKSESSYKGNHQGFEPNFEPSFEPTGLDPQGFQAIDDDDIPF